MDPEKILDSNDTYADKDVSLAFSQTLRSKELYEKGLEESLNLPTGYISNPPNEIVFVGVGGSGIVGEYVRDIVSGPDGLRVHVLKTIGMTYRIKEDDLLIAISYSGKTAETLLSLNQALAKGCKALAVTSGGVLEELCRKKNIPVIKVEAGLQPRMALMSMLGSCLGFLSLAGLVDYSIDELKRASSTIKLAISKYKPASKFNVNRAKLIANEIYLKIPIIYSYGHVSACGYRMKTQFNENAKVHAFYSHVPECLHNEVEAWINNASLPLTGLILRAAKEDSIVKSLLDQLSRLLSSSGFKVHDIKSEGSNKLEDALYLTVLCDLITLYVAVLRSKNPLKLYKVGLFRETLRSLLHY